MEKLIFSHERKYRPGSGSNGLILGQPGSGKTYLAQKEIINVLKNTDDEVYVIDTTGEYSHLLKFINGQEIKIGAGSKTYINPMDMDIEYMDWDPIPLKSDFVLALYEALIGQVLANEFEISALKKSIIDRCVRTLYVKHLEHMETIKHESITCDFEASLTLSDLYKLLLEQPEPEAKNIALALERYLVELLDIFSYKTNVKLNNRFVVFNLQNIGHLNEQFGTLTVLNFVWNKIKENRRKGKTSWVYIDELYPLIKSKLSAEFLKTIWKMSRVNRGIITGITQNTEDLLDYEKARSILNNSNFLYILKQNSKDVKKLADLLDLGEEGVNIITGKSFHNGLCIIGPDKYPFKIS